MRREFHVRFCEGPEGKFLRATRPMILVKSRRAGQRVMSSVQRGLARCLRLVVNEKKSRVAAVSQCPYLGFVVHRGRLKIAPSVKVKFKKRIRELTNLRARARTT